MVRTSLRFARLLASAFGLLVSVSHCLGQTLDHFAWSGVPGIVSVGQGFLVSIEARDISNRLVTTFSGPVALSEASSGAMPSVLVTEVETIATERVEFSNLSTNEVDISGWRVLLYDSASWPEPKITFTIPATTSCPGLGLFELRANGTAPGSYPVLSTGVSLSWNSASSRNQQAVVLLDRAGNVVDFFCAVDAYSQQIAAPFNVTSAIWSGGPVPANANKSLTYQRVGHSDHDNAADWTGATNTFGVPNPRLQLPFIASTLDSALLPGSVTFSNGTWSGLVSASLPATNALLRADDLTGHAGDSSPLTVQALPALSVQMPKQSFKATPGFVGEGSVALPQPLSSDVSITLSSSQTNHIQVPPAVVISAGSTTGLFGVTNLDDGLIEGPQAVQVTASASGFQAGTDTITNYDRPVALSVTLPASIFETSGWVSGGQVQAGGVVAANVLVRLFSSNTNRVQVPDFVVIAKGQQSAALGLAVIDNALADGDETITITATVPGWNTGQGQTLLRDNEWAALTVAAPYQVLEGSAWLTNAASIGLLGLLPTNLTVALTSSAPATIQVPDNVTIAAGQISNSFSLFVGDDSTAGPDQSITITGTALGFQSGVRTIKVLDNGLYRFALDSLTAAQIAGQPFQVRITALNQSGDTLRAYAGTLHLTARGYQGSAAVSPALIGPFTNGVWSGSVTAPDSNRGLVLTFDNGAGTAVSSAPFDVVPDRILSLPAVDLAFDALRGQLLAAVIANSASTGQCIIPIEPGSGALGAAIPLEADPAKLAISDDYTYLYTAMANNSTGGVARVNLGSHAVDLRFPLGTVNQYGQAVNWVEDMKVQPGHPHTLLATTRIRDAYNHNIALYDDGVMRPDTVSPVYYVRTYHLTFADSPFWFYVTKPNGLWINSISASGATFLKEIEGARYGADMVFAGDSLFATSGDVFNTNNYSVIGSFSATGQVIPDLARGRVYFLAQDPTPSFVAFDRQTFRKIANLALPNVSGQVGSFVSCGSNLFAFQTSGGQVHIVDTSMLYTNVCADLALAVQVSQAQPMVGSNLTYSVTVSNAGPGTSFGVRLTNQLPALSAFVSANPTAGTYSFSNGTVICVFGDLTNGATGSVDIVIQPAGGGSLAAAFTVDALTVDLNQANNGAVDVRNAGVAGGVLSFCALSLSANDIVFDPATQLIFASVPPSPAGLSNCLVTLDPLTGQIGTPRFVGRQPTRLAVAPGGGSLYIGLDGDYAVRRYDTVSQTLYAPFSLGDNTVALDLAVRPGAPQTVAVSRWVPSAASFADVALYDSGTPRPAIVHSPHVEFSPDGSLLYGSGWNGPNWVNTSGDDFYVSEVIGAGLSAVSAIALPFSSNLEMRMSRGLAYYPPGLVLDPSVGLLSQAFLGIGYSPCHCVDEPANRVFFLSNDGQSWYLQQFNLTSHALEASRVLGTLPGTAQDLIRWGPSGLAFRNDAGQVFLVQIPALPQVPQLAVTQSASPSAGTLGSNLDYLISVTNRGPVDATNVVLTDVLPTGALYVSASGSQGSVTQSQGTVVFALGTLSNGASATLHLVAAPRLAGWNMNTNYATASAYDFSSGVNGSVVFNWVGLGTSLSLTNQFSVPGFSSLTYDSLNQVIYAAVNGSGGPLSNCIATIDARTGNLRSRLNLGDLPARFALSDDSHYLYVALASTGGVARVDLNSNSVDLRFALGVNDRFGFYGAGDLKVVPGQPRALAVSINHGQSNEGVTIYDDGVPRTNSVPGSQFAGTYWISFGASPSALYSTFPFTFRTIAVDALGAKLLAEDANLVPGYNPYFEYDAGRVYFQTGRIVDPVKRTIVGQLPVSGLVAPDAAAGRVYFVTTVGSAPFGYQLTLRAWDLATTNELWSVAFPLGSGGGTQLLKCGTNGLALLTDTGNLFLVHTATMSTPAADVSISQTTPTTPTAGATLSFIYTIRNSGPWTATGLVITNSLPSGATFISASSSQGSAGFTNGVVVCALGSLTNTGSATLTVKYMVPVSGLVTNVATVSHSELDPDLAGNTSVATINVLERPGVLIRDASAVQTAVGKAFIAFNLSLSSASGTPVSVNYQTADGTAVAGTDYDAASGVVTFPAGGTNAALNLNIIRPAISALPSKFFYLNLFSPTNAAILRTPAVGTILTRNYLALSVANCAAVEGNTGVTNAQFKLSLNATSAVPVAVQYRTIPGTASPGSDYQSMAGTVVIPAGTTNLTLPVPVFGDVGWEPDETFYLLLAQAQNAVLSVDEATATILNDDPYPALNARLDSGNLALSWLGGPYTLQSSTNVSGPYMDLPSVTSPYTNALETQPGRFFRLRTQSP